MSELKKEKSRLLRRLNEEKQIIEQAIKASSDAIYKINIISEQLNKLEEK